MGMVSAGDGDAAPLITQAHQGKDRFREVEHCLQSKIYIAEGHQVNTQLNPHLRNIKKMSVRLKRELGCVLFWCTRVKFSLVTTCRLCFKVARVGLVSFHLLG